jgi:hypothetical protein
MFSVRLQQLIPGINIKQLWLHRFGSDAIDQIWIEHNDFLMRSESNSAIRSAMINYLFESDLEWHEIYVGLSTTHVLSAFHHKMSHQRTDIESPSYSVNLQDIKCISDYLAALSKNTRSQILRSKKLLEGFGNLELKRAMTLKEKEHYLHELSVIHMEKWGDTAFGSGFSNQKFLSFHRQIIVKNDNEQYCRVYCLLLNNEALGYIYILADKGSWNFYLSAIKSHHDNRIKIGLVFHALVIEDAINYNVNSYHFLAGEARYKKSLSNTSEYHQELVCFYKPVFIILFRERLRTIKYHFQNLMQSLFK